MTRGLLVLLLLLPFADAHAAGTEQLAVGDEAPQFVLKALNPKQSNMTTFALRKFVGVDATEPKRAVVLSFAASYCEPCKRELGELKKLEAKLGASNVVLAVVVIDTEAEGIEKMRKLTVEELGLTYPVLTDRFGVLAKRYHASMLPMTVVVKPDGKIKWLSSGFREGAIDALLGELAIEK